MYAADLKKTALKYIHLKFDSRQKLSVTNVECQMSNVENV